MMRHPSTRHGKRRAARLRGIRRRAAQWRRRLRRASTLAVLAAAFAVPSGADAQQLGQSAMAPATGLVNSAAARLAGPVGEMPGFLYYGVNGADRGLGYVGSYMTLGGFVPFAEDDLGGFWAADLRGHLSTYGGFFSNVGAVRKQFIGGTLLGVGVYWDYDGDMNQYPNTPIPVGLGNTYTFAGGQTYNQVGVSGEWLTDYGNIRSNGYIPVGSTAQLVGPFLGNVLLCQNGVNAALGGADLEVGAYVPALADWAGMVSVGGYALGNTRYSFPTGQTAVPWFGGVYTRLDLTFARNWDFSLQANNDSYFDWTGFARLTYRMGGSRRRNVPDQVEQPMMRNEHIVRAHQTPEVAINPANGQPWQVFHVDNTAAAGGNGSAESPFTTLGEASAAALTAYDIVYLRAGNGSTYVTPASGFTFNAPNQYLVGEGTSLTIPTLACGNRTFLTGLGTSVYPVISNPVGTAVVIDQPNVTVSHVQIVGSPVGISDGAGGIASPNVATISDVIIQGNGGPSQRGIEIASSTGEFRLDNVRLSSLSNDGLVVSAANGRATVTNSSFTAITGNAIRVSGAGAAVAASDTTITGNVGDAVRVSGAGASVDLTRVAIADTSGDAVVLSGSGAAVSITASQITNTSNSALVTVASGTITATASSIIKTGNPAVLVAGDSSAVTLDASEVRDVAGTGVVVSGSSARITMTNAARIDGATGDGITVIGPTAFADIQALSLIANVGGDGINTTGGSIHVVGSSIQNVGSDGIEANGVDGTRVVWVQGGSISGALDNGIRAANSNLRVEQIDPANPTSQGTRISNTQEYGILAEATVAGATPYRVLVDGANISNVVNGIGVIANAGGPPIPTIDFNAETNTIRASGNGILVRGFFDRDLVDRLSLVNARMIDNTIAVGTTGSGIVLDTVNSTLFVTPAGDVQAPFGVRPVVVAANSLADLSNLNNGATTAITPLGSTVAFLPTLLPTTPPPPPTPP